MAEATDIAPGAPCPICGKPAGSRFRPFCSTRCADVDLNRWLSDVYVVPGEPDAEEDGTLAEQKDSGGSQGEDGA